VELANNFTSNILVIHQLIRRPTTTTTTPVLQPLFQDNLGKMTPEGKTILDLNELDNMQTICTLLQTDNHANTLPLNFTD